MKENADQLNTCGSRDFVNIRQSSAVHVKYTQ